MNTETKRIIENLLRSTKREGIENLIKWLEQNDFYTAPASSKLGYHGCYEGGLVKHSLNVYVVFERRVKEFNLEARADEMIIASLCHDLCKVNYYKPNRLKSGALSKDKPYVADNSFPLGHGEKSVSIAQKFIELTEKEALLIRWHMGPYDRSWEDYSDKVAQVCPEINAFHHADMEASRYMD